MDFAATGQGGEEKIFSSLFKNYWRIGFWSRLYDALCPEAYHESLRRTADWLDVEEGGWILDAGCGSGILLPRLADKLRGNRRYLGLDILPAGLETLVGRARGLEPRGRVYALRSNLTQNLPLKDYSISCAAAHFSIYTLPDKEDRLKAYRELYRVLKTGSLLVAANPVASYQAEAVIRSSLELLKSRKRPWRFNKLLVYPLTLRFGLNYIQRQLRSGKWHGYQPGEMQEEINTVGFSIEHSETIYGGSGILVAGRKR